MLNLSNPNEVKSLEFDKKIDLLEISEIPQAQLGPKTIDGALSNGEWDNAQFKFEFEMDVDNIGNPPNADGFNYLYLDEDDVNLYIALDLCSDQTNDENGEWIGVWLKTDDVATETYAEYYDQFDIAVESLIYDVDNDQIFPEFSDSLSSSYRSIISADQMEVIIGTATGDYTWLVSTDDPDFTIMAENVAGTYTTRLDFMIDYHDYFEFFPDAFIDQLTRVGTQIQSYRNVTIDSHQCILWGPDGVLDLNDPSMQFDLNVGTASLDDYTINNSPTNLTSEGILKISYIATNNLPFNISYEEFTVFRELNSSSFASGGLQFPFSSIASFDLAWDFLPSENNASNHRIFEYSIPKSEIGGYYSADDLGIIVGGYGTMSFPDNDYWVFENDPDPGGFYYSESYAYMNFSMAWKFSADQAPAAIALEVNGEENTPDGKFTLSWTDADRANNFTLYAAATPFTTIFDAGLTKIIDQQDKTSSEITVDKEQTIYYQVVALNNEGFTKSNLLKVVITFGEPDDDPSGLETWQIILIVVGSVAAVAVVMVVVVKKKKQK